MDNKVNLFKLQNSSDIRATAISAPNDPAVLTPNVVEAIAYGFGIFLKNEMHIPEPVISVGRDCRLSGEELEVGVISGLYASGAKKVYSFGLATTPSMYVSTKAEYLNCDGAIELTASHLPFNKNGMKFFTKQGGTDSAQVKTILTYATEYSGSEGKKQEKAIEYDFISDYAAGLIKLAQSLTGEEKPFDKMKVLVDAGNGASGFFCEKVLNPLGADTSMSLYLEADGHFPNHIPNPENDAVMEEFSKQVGESGADIGIIFDTDGDRAALAECGGKPLGKSRLIALASEIVLRSHPNTIIVTDSVTSTCLTGFIEQLGGIHHRFKRGYNNVISEAKRLSLEGKSAALAIETSGHAAIEDNDYLDDGAYLALRALVRLSELKKEGRDFSDLLKSYRDPATQKEIRPEIYAEDFAACAQKVIDAFSRFSSLQPGWSVVTPNYEGVRINCDTSHGAGFILMRLSLHEAVLPINIESDSADGEAYILQKLRSFLAEYKKDIQEV